MDLRELDCIYADEEIEHDTEFSLAPWFFDGDDTIKDGTGRTSDECDICYINNEIDKYKHNANLIAAAPEMLTVMIAISKEEAFKNISAYNQKRYFNAIEKALFVSTNEGQNK